MFENDICLCANNENCPYRLTCQRAKSHGPGIYTMSLFYQENEECEYYLPVKTSIKGE